MEAFQRETGREPAIEEIAKELGMEPEEIVLSMEAVVEVESMDQSIFAADGKEIFLKERIADEKNEEEELLDKLLLEQLLNTLDERDKKLILMRYFENKTQTQVAASCSQTQTGGRQLKLGSLCFVSDFI